MMKKAVGGDRETHEIAMTFEDDLVDGAHGRPFLRKRAERAEVAFPDQVRGSGAHRFEIERPPARATRNAREAPTVPWY